MLAVSPRNNNIKDEKERINEGFEIEMDEFLDFPEGNLLDNIDFDELFVGMDGCDVLHDLEMDREMFADFSSSGGEESEVNNMSFFERIDENSREDHETLSSTLYTQAGEEIVSKREESQKGSGEKWKKSSKRNTQGKRKVKVDWTPELHRRFVQAVEQLGVDKAVPSRILELMGIDCLTRHNIASHLQKYRSHRKHLLAREAEAATWSHRRKLYTIGGGGKNASAWVSPASAMGFPPPMTPLPSPHMQHFRPLHVWGHPPMDQSLMHMWPKHLVPPSSLSPPPPLWVPPPQHPSSPRHPPDPSFWHRHHQKVPKSFTPVTPGFPQPMSIMKFRTAPVTLIPPSPRSQQHSLHRQTGPQPPLDFHPSKESIDAAIGDVLSKPWSPLPLGLKPPSVDVVLVELQCQGISNIPPSCA